MHTYASEAIKAQETENIKKDAVKVDDRSGGGEEGNKRRWKERTEAGGGGEESRGKYHCETALHQDWAP